MSITITDPVLLTQLNAVPGPIDVHGPNGEFIGTFQPPFGAPPPGFKIPFSEEEFAELRKQRTGRPLADILKDLRERYGE